MADGRTAVNIVFDREFNSTWPATYPMSVDQIDGKVFLKRYMDRVCAQVSYLFYDHRLSEEME